jgi:hypothetical protein
MMNESHRSSLAFSRGLLAAILCGLGGAVASVAVALGFTVCRWLVSGTTEYDRLRIDLRSLESDMVIPIIGCAIVFACAGWATFAPAGTYRFARSLVVVFLVSVALWYVIGSMELTPRRYRGIEHPLLYASELIVLMASPMLAAALLTVIRIRSATMLPSNQKSEKSKLRRLFLTRAKLLPAP